MRSPIQYSNDTDSAVVHHLERGGRREHQGHWQLAAVNCPRCEARLRLDITLTSLMDSCGLENCRLECDACGIRFVGIVDPYDDALLLAELP